MDWRNHLIDARRLASCRAPKFSEAKLTTTSIMLIFAGLVLARVVFQFFQSSGLSSFSLYGINSSLAGPTVAIAIILAFAQVDPTPRTLRNLVLLNATAFAIGLIAAEATTASLNYLVSHKPAGWMSTAVSIEIIKTVGMVAWVTGAARQIFKLVNNVRRPALRAFAFTACIVLASAALPHWPVFLPQKFDLARMNYWEFISRIRNQAADTADREEDAASVRDRERKSASIEGHQPDRLNAALAAIEKRDAGKANIFVLGLAGYGDQDVFEHETEQSVEILKSRFDVGNRIMRLVNADDTTDRYPIASIQNLSAALHGISARMDRDKDVLILTMTSHGSPDGFALRFGDLIYRTLDPITLKRLLDDAGIKNRVLIVAACYSGVFVPVLANDDTMIMTAASATRTSFGCASGREWTYFGDAFFALGLKTEPTLAAAFAVARKTIGQWETKERLLSSDPQIFVGKNVARRFPGLVGPIPSEASRPRDAELDPEGSNNRMN